MPAKIKYPLPTFNGSPYIGKHAKGAKFTVKYIYPVLDKTAKAKTIANSWPWN